jgi:Fe2+ or Zn2+ uptake regulation protein
MVPALEIDLERVNSTDFEIIGHRLEFLGVCPICSDKSDRDANRKP